MHDETTTHLWPVQKKITTVENLTERVNKLYHFQLHISPTELTYHISPKQQVLRLSSILLPKQDTNQPQNYNHHNRDAKHKYANDYGGRHKKKE